MKRKTLKIKVAEPSDEEKTPDTVDIFSRGSAQNQKHRIDPGQIANRTILSSTVNSSITTDFDKKVLLGINPRLPDQITQDASYSQTMPLDKREQMLEQEDQDAIQQHQLRLRSRLESNPSNSEQLHQRLHFNESNRGFGSSHPAVDRRPTQNNGRDQVPIHQNRQPWQETFVVLDDQQGQDKISDVELSSETRQDEEIKVQSRNIQLPSFQTFTSILGNPQNQVQINKTETANAIGQYTEARYGSHNNRQKVEEEKIYISADDERDEDQLPFNYQTFDDNRKIRQANNFQFQRQIVNENLNTSQAQQESLHSQLHQEFPERLVIDRIPIYEIIKPQINNQEQKSGFENWEDLNRFLRYSKYYSKQRYEIQDEVTEEGVIMSSKAYSLFNRDREDYTSLNKTIDPEGNSQQKNNKQKSLHNEEVDIGFFQHGEEQLYFSPINLDALQKEELERWKTRDVKGLKRTLYIKKVERKNDGIMAIKDKPRLQRVREYVDKYPCLKIRKQLMKLQVYIQALAQRVIFNKLFEAFTITLIVSNSIVLAFEDPTNPNQSQFTSFLDDFYLFAYTGELILKILGMGFVFNKGAYLRDAWNVLDFIIVASGFFTLLFSSVTGSLNLSGIRAFRVLRPLRTISSIEGLKTLVQALLSSLQLLRDTIIILLFFFMIFAIAGLQIFHGTLKRRCINIENGMQHKADYICGGNFICPSGYFCGRHFESPNYGVTNFDNILYSLLTVFQSVTLEGWSSVMEQVWQAQGSESIVYYVPLVFIGGFFLINLTLAVINSKFTEAHKQQIKLNQERKKKDKLKSRRKMLRIQNNIDDEFLDKNITVRQFQVAQKIAKQMVQFLRKRQDLKKAQMQRRQIMRHRVSVGAVLAVQDVPFKLQQNGLGQRKLSVIHESMSYSFSEEFKSESFQTSSKEESKSQSNCDEPINIQIKAPTYESEEELNQDPAAHYPRLSTPLPYSVTKKDSTAFFSSNEMFQPRSSAVVYRESNFAKVYAERMGNRKSKRDEQPTDSEQEESKFNLRHFYNSKERQRSSVTSSSSSGSKNSEGREQIPVNKYVGNIIVEEIQCNDNNNQQIQLNKFIQNVAVQYASQSENRSQTPHSEKQYRILKYSQLGSQIFSEKQSYRNLKMTGNLGIATASIKTFDNQQRVQSISPTSQDDQERQQIFEQQLKDIDQMIPSEEYYENQRNIFHKQLTEVGGAMAISNSDSLIKDNSIEFLEESLVFKKQTGLIRDDSGNPSLLSSDPDIKFMDFTGFPSINKGTKPIQDNQVIVYKGRKNAETEDRFILSKQITPPRNNLRLQEQQPFQRPESSQLDFSLEDEKFMINLDEQERYQNTNQRRESYIKQRTSDNNNSSALNQNQETVKRESRQGLFGFKKSHSDKFEENRKNSSKATIMKDLGIVNQENDDKLLPLQDFALSSIVDGNMSYQTKENWTTPGKQSVNGPKAFNFQSYFQFRKDQEERKQQQSIQENKHTKAEDVSLFGRKLSKLMQVSLNKMVIQRALDQNNKKIQIVKNADYNSTSQNDVLEKKYQNQALKQFEDQYKYVKQVSEVKPISKNQNDQITTFESKAFRNQYSYKTFYDVYSDDDEDFLDEWQLQQFQDNTMQPFDTMTGIAYEDMLRDLPTKQIARKSNIIVTSTLSFTYQPKDRINRKKSRKFAKMTEESIENPTVLRSQNGFRRANIITEQLEDIGFQGDQSGDFFTYLTPTIGKTKKHQNSPQKVPLNALKRQTRVTQQSPLTRLLSRVNGEKTLSSGTLSRKTSLQQRRKSLRKTSANKNDARTPDPKSMILYKSLFNSSRKKIFKMKQMQKQFQQQGIDKKFTLKEAKKIFDGTFYSDDEEEHKDENAKGFGAYGSKSYQLMKQRTKQSNEILAYFERGSALKSLDKDPKNLRKKEDQIDEKFSFCEVPLQVREELDLPDDIKDIEIDFQAIKKRDATLKIRHMYWSGQDVLERKPGLKQLIDEERSKWVAKHLNNIRVWPKGVKGKHQKFRVFIKKIIQSSVFENFMLLAVLLNTIVLGMDRYQIPDSEAQTLTQMNDAFTIIFILEMVLKLIAVGMKKYFNDKLNYLDSLVVVISMIDSALTISGSSGKSRLSAFKTVRIFRTFRVLRVARLLRSLRSMQVIIGVMQRSIMSFVYIAALLLIFIFIFSLLGMQIFGGQFAPQVNQNQADYDTFSDSFLTVFQVLTIENWQSILYHSMSTSLGRFLPVVYYVVWIFMGNYILLNLFLAILLDAFIEEEQEKEDLEVEEEQKKLTQLKNKAQSKKLTSLYKEIQKKQRQREMEKRRKMMEYQTQKRSILKMFSDGQLEQEWEEDYSEDEDRILNLEEMDEADIHKILIDNGIVTQSQIKVNSRRQEKLDLVRLFKEVSCQKSLYLFSRRNKFRVNLFRMTKNRYFELGIQIIIILSSIKLAADTYVLDEPSDSKLLQLSDSVDIIFTLLFTIESIIKTICLGFVMDHGSYLRESWNVLDFFIVVSSMVDLCLVEVNLPFLKILRLLRTLRPLRFISHNITMKTMVTALFESVGHIFNVIIVVMIVWLMFAILGINFFAGKFFYCTVDTFTLSNESQCLKNNGEWLVYDHNFDNVGNAMVTLFALSTIEDWPLIMDQAINSTNENQGPSLNNSPASAYYFVVFIFIGSYFLMNFFIGVLFLKYNEAQRAEERGFTQEHLHWIDMQKMILQAKPDFETTNVPSSEWRQKIHSLVGSQKFDIFIMACIVLNMIQMSLTYEDQPQFYQYVLDTMNTVLTSIFACECILKLIAYKFSYFSSHWNKFDFTLVTTSLLDLALNYLSNNSLQYLRFGPSLARVLRVLRVTRIIRLIGKYKGLQALIETIAFSLPQLMNVLGLLLIVFFMFAVLGVFFFSDIKKGVIIDDNFNFKNFGYSLLILFRMSTGEDWNYIMFDCAREKADGCIPGVNCGSKVIALVYFISFIMICQNIMLNLFVLIIIQQFDKYYLPQDNIISRFKNDLQAFKDSWKDFTMEKYNCSRIKETQLTQFLEQLKVPLGMPGEAEADLKKTLLKMEIKRDSQGFVYFNELLYRFMRRIYGNLQLNRQMQVIELRTQYKLIAMTLQLEGNFKKMHLTELSSWISFIKQKNQDNLLRKQEVLTKKSKDVEIMELLTGKSNFVNPILTMMYFSMSFKAWFNHTKTQKENKALQQKALRRFSVRQSITDQSMLERLASQIEKKIMLESHITMKEFEYESEVEILKSYPTTPILTSSLEESDRSSDSESDDSQSHNNENSSQGRYGQRVSSSLKRSSMNLSNYSVSSFIQEDAKFKLNLKSTFGVKRKVQTPSSNENTMRHLIDQSFGNSSDHLISSRVSQELTNQIQKEYHLNIAVEQFPRTSLIPQYLRKSFKDDDKFNYEASEDKHNSQIKTHGFSLENSTINLRRKSNKKLTKNKQQSNFDTIEEEEENHVQSYVTLPKQNDQNRIFNNQF